MHAPASPSPLDVIIVGAGISGIGMAAHLARKCPNKRYAVVDRRERLGGTWDLFRYPGVRSDSDMYTLGFEFEPWRDGRAIASGETILSYLDSVVAKYGVADHIRLGETALSADWDSDRSLWTLRTRTADGEDKALTGRFLYLGSGYYDHDQPYDAPIPGLEGFGGPIIHPQFWRDDIDLSGKKIVVIGSGATAATVVPALAQTAAHAQLLHYAARQRLAGPAAPAHASGQGCLRADPRQEFPSAGYVRETIQEKARRSD